MGWIVLVICAIPFIYGIISEIRRQRANKAAFTAAEHTRRRAIRAQEKRLEDAIQRRRERENIAREKAVIDNRLYNDMLLSLDEQYAILLKINRHVKRDISNADEKQLKKLLSIEKQLGSVEKQRATARKKLVDLRKYT